ncbi:MAG TPA: hypothetical protein VFL91_17760, partial [Thermomicrobiales bacterium]|nr:hypothetical protein [Thermomicrobiales bacterium]
VEGIEAGNYLDPGIAGATPTQPHGDQLFRAVDAATRRILDECYGQAASLLVANRERLDRLAEALVRAESLDEVALRRAAGLAQPPDAPAALATPSPVAAGA